MSSEIDIAWFGKHKQHHKLADKAIQVRCEQSNKRGIVPLARGLSNNSSIRATMRKAKGRRHAISNCTRN
jgi:uncharacterized ferritin-like protein (DUF455 family)